MSRYALRFGFAALLCAATACFTQQNPAAGAPDGATGQCKDGTYTKIPTKSKACKGHQGVKAWFATVGGPTNPDIKGTRPTQTGSAKQAARSDQVVNPHTDANVSSARADAINKKSGNAAAVTPDNNNKTVPGPAANTSKGSSSSAVSGRNAASGGGPGLVWLNTQSKIYHCYGTAGYGATKNGKYVSEKDAINMGARPALGRRCSQQ
jgi:hypothetical protein